MADKKKEALDLDALLKDAESRIFEFEKAIQTGEADQDQYTKQKKALEKERARKLLKYRMDVQQVVAQAFGRRVLWRILELCGPNRISYVPGDTHATAVNEGKRMIANEVLLMIYDVDSAVYSQMQREHASDLKVERERKKKEIKEVEEEDD